MCTKCKVHSTLPWSGSMRKLFDSYYRQNYFLSSHNEYLTNLSMIQINPCLVWEAWGYALLRIEHYAQARVKFKWVKLLHCSIIWMKCILELHSVQLQNILQHTFKSSRFLGLSALFVGIRCLCSRWILISDHILLYGFQALLAVTYWRPSYSGAKNHYGYGSWTASRFVWCPLTVSSSILLLSLLPTVSCYMMWYIMLRLGVMICPKFLILRSIMIVWLIAYLWILEMVWLQVRTHG